jgi:hypothetical protein
MRWQREKRAPRRLVEEARREYCERADADCELETLLSGKPTELNVRSHLHNRRPYRDPDAQPVKWMKLIQWWLVHRIPIDTIVTPQVEAAACMRFGIPEWKWEEAKKRFPNLLPKVNQKRLRRMEYALETGKFPPTGRNRDSWDRRSIRCEFFLAQVLYQTASQTHIVPWYYCRPISNRVNLAKAYHQN